MKARVKIAAIAILCLTATHSQTLAHHEVPPPPPVQPPMPSPPPPSTQPNTNLTTLQYSLPPVPQNSINPTDLSGIGGSLGAAQGLKQKLDCTCKDKPGKHQHMSLIPTDPRYDFTGEWLAFPHTEDDIVAVASNEDNPTGVTTNRKIGRVVQRVYTTHNRKQKEALFMPTKDAQYQRETDGLLLIKGALLVKANHSPTTIFMMVNGQRVNTKVGACAISMVSLVEDRLIVVNLTDTCCGACSVAVGMGDRQRTIAVGTGEVLEIFASDSQPASLPVTAKILSTQGIGDGLSVQVARHHYVTTLKRYNICKCLPKEDVERVLKTAAALLYAQQR